MIKYIPLAKQLRTKIKKIDANTDASVKIAADLDYIAMMCDIDLDGGDEEGENENAQSEVL